MKKYLKGFLRFSNNVFIIILIMYSILLSIYTKYGKTMTLLVGIISYVDGIKRGLVGFEKSIILINLL